jgi:hypothetical protein
MKKEKTSICPVCGSNETKFLVNEKGKFIRSSLTHGKHLECSGCNYKGPVGTPAIARYIIYIWAVISLIFIFMGEGGGILDFIIPFIAVGLYMDYSIIRKKRKEINKK